MKDDALNYHAIGEALFHMSNVGLVFSRPDTTIFQVNDALCNFIGYTRKELYNIKWPDITHPDDARKDLREFTRIRNGEIDSYTMEKRYLRKSGGIFWAEVDVKCIWKNAREMDYFVAVVKDISERKVTELRLEGQLELASNLNDQLKIQKNRLVEYTHLLSHDLRSPVATLKSLIQLHEDLENEGEKAKVLEKLNLVSENVLETIQNVSQSMEQESEGKQETRETTDPEEVFNWVKVNLAHQIEKNNARIEFVQDTSLAFPGKRNLYHSIFQNLITNSIKYRRKDAEPVITIHTREYEGHIILKISDNGQGIDLDKYGDRLFNMYQTFHGGEDSHGIGLYLVKTQIETLNGTINVNSEVGKGTTFTITLPAVK